MTTERTPPAPPTTPPTVAHDWCDDCQGYTHAPWCPAYMEEDKAAEATEEPYETVLRLALEHTDRSAAAIRARRTALLERADANSPTEGAVALAEAYLDAADWWQQLPNNALQDAEAYALAKHIDSEIDNWLTEQQRLRRSEWSV